MTGRHAQALVPRTLAPIRKRRKRPTTDTAYAGMVGRMQFGQAKRAAVSHEALSHVLTMESNARDYANLAIYMAHYAEDHPTSLSTIGDLLGISKQAVAKRVNLGREVAGRLEAEGKL